MLSPTNRFALAYANYPVAAARRIGDGMHKEIRFYSLLGADAPITIGHPLLTKDRP
jgi:hypothetical protein